VNLVVAVNNFGDTRAGGLAGPMGLFIIVLMCIATVLLIRNMNKHVRQLPDSFQDSETARRRAEITRLEADVQSPAAAPARLEVDGDRSAAAGSVKEPEVNGSTVVDAPQGERAATDGS
jgi:hypothetical protein